MCVRSLERVSANQGVEDPSPKFDICAVLDENRDDFRTICSCGDVKRSLAVGDPDRVSFGDGARVEVASLEEPSYDVGMSGFGGGMEQPVARSEGVGNVVEIDAENVGSVQENRNEHVAETENCDGGVVGEFGFTRFEIVASSDEFFDNCRYLKRMEARFLDAFHVSSDLVENESARQGSMRLSAVQPAPRTAAKVPRRRRSTLEDFFVHRQDCSRLYCCRALSVDSHCRQPPFAQCQLVVAIQIVTNIVVVFETEPSPLFIDVEGRTLCYFGHSYCAGGGALVSYASDAQRRDTGQRRFG